MPVSKNIGTRDVPLKFAKELTEIVNDSFISGKMLEQVSTITKDLLNYWFSNTFCEARQVNFHVGQKQAILNTIYVHEILKTSSIIDTYDIVNNDLLHEIGIKEISKDKYNHSKYCMKMATGTGKTWVMHALLIWQYLNAKYDTKNNVAYSKNFLLVAPGLIVYERLLDAYLGKENINGNRDFETSDISMFQDLFIPPNYIY